MARAACTDGDVPRLIEALRSLPRPEEPHVRPLALTELFATPEMLEVLRELDGDGLDSDLIVRTLMTHGVGGSPYMIRRALRSAVHQTSRRAARPPKKRRPRRRHAIEPVSASPQVDVAASVPPSTRKAEVETPRRLPRIAAAAPSEGNSAGAPRVESPFPADAAPVPATGPPSRRRNVAFREQEL